MSGNGIPYIQSCRWGRGWDRVTDIKLRSLGPQYDKDHHQTYVSRLNAAVTDPRNKNIALTGRYGTGKSSILDKFIQEQESAEAQVSEDDKTSKKRQTLWRKRKKPSSKKVLRISINTLGPDKHEDLTNRIQKELVKQLVYRAKPGEISSSEFARAPRLKWWQAGRDALAISIVLVGLLWLFGLRPIENSLGTDDLLLPMASLFVLVLGILWAIRWYIGNRVIAQVSAGGASIALEGTSDSFFDRYLDELMTFFEATEPDIVVFEDLDRFDDPRIFDSLRELNTLVNSSAHWRNRRDRPLRFVYAIKDSLFEKLGDEQQEKDEPEEKKPEEGIASSLGTASHVKVPEKRDAAAEAVERANRTKFFEIVIPVVPFLSHSNARDHLVKQLDRLKAPTGQKVQIARGLVDSVARHTTDMRLMLNICNEFVVYAEQLLWVDGTKKKCAPGLTPDHLFALVVYKNFHLADFEALPHRGSALDMLDQARRDFVDAAITNLQHERSGLVTGVTRQQRQLDLASKLSERLTVVLQTSQKRLAAATADGVSLDVESTNDPLFWHAIARAHTAELQLAPLNGFVSTGTMNQTDITSVFPEIKTPNVWLDVPSHRDGKRLAEIDSEISSLRGIDFKKLLNDVAYTLNGKTFAELAKDILPSELALDRFYAEYATVFFGEFLGVDVAKFFRNSVWPNEMDTQFEFTTPGAVKNVIEQAPTDFLCTRSALNVDIVNHLMTIDDSSSSQLIDFLMQPNNEDGRQFLSTYLNTPTSQGEELVSRLAAKSWPALFSFIASKDTIDGDEKNGSLLNAALQSAPNFETFELDDDARALIARLHTEIPAFGQDQRSASMKTLFAFLTAALPSVPNLRALSPDLQDLVVDAKQYTLDVSNLRAAAMLPDESPISADNLIVMPVVWEHCTENVEGYLSLVASDEQTTGTCESPDVLAQIVNAQHAEWSVEQMAAFLDASADSAALPDITVVEQTAWATVVDRLCVVPNFTNLEAYVTRIGVDDALAALLTDDDGAVVDIINVEDATEDRLESLATLLLNAKAVLEPRQRVLLAKQMLDTPNSPSLDLSEIEASSDDLLAELLTESIIDDTAESFAHFSDAGWSSIGPALQVSTNASTFITPELTQGHTEEVVRGSEYPEATRRAILERLVEFAAVEEQPFLAIAASAARTLRVALPTEALKLIAPAVKDHEDVLWQLNEQTGSITARMTMQILGTMSGDFTGFAGASNHKFVVGDTPSLKYVLDVLRDAGEIVPQPGRQPRGRWKLRIA